MNTPQTVWIRLSDFPKIREYLNASAIDVEALSTDLVHCGEEVARCDADLARRKAKLADAERNLGLLKDEHEGTLAAIDDDINSKSIALRKSPYEYEHCIHVGCTEGAKAVMHEAAALEQELEALKQSRRDQITSYCSTPEFGQMKDAQAAVDTAYSVVTIAQSVKVKAENALAKAKERIARATAQVPEVVRSLDRGRLEAGLSNDWELPDEFPSILDDIPVWTVAAILREELESPCRCDRGYVSVALDDLQEPLVLVLLDDCVRHPLCATRVDVQMVTSAIDEKFRGHRLHSLEPHNRSPLSLDRQAKVITHIPARNDDLYGWLMVGDFGTSKTTYAAGAVIDWLTWRAVDAAKRKLQVRYDPDEAWNPRDYDDKRVRLADLNFWWIEVPSWTRDQDRWENRDFKDTTITEPPNSLDHIKVMTEKSGFAPIILLEEMDKFSPTKNRLDRLSALVNYAYRKNGTIITTANLHLRELRDLVGGAIYRRLSGENDDPKGYLVWDFFELKKTTARSTASKKEKG